MALREETRQIGDHSYYCMQLPARKSMMLKARLARILGKPLTTLLSSAGKSNEDQANAVVSAISDLFEKGNESEVVDFIVEVVCMANVDKTRIDGNKFDEIFSDNLIDAYKVFMFVIEVNYGNLFKGQLEGISSQLAKIKA